MENEIETEIHWLDPVTYVEYIEDKLYVCNYGLDPVYLNEDAQWSLFKLLSVKYNSV